MFIIWNYSVKFVGFRQVWSIDHGTFEDWKWLFKAGNVLVAKATVSLQTNTVKNNARVYSAMMLAFSEVCCCWLALSPTDDVTTIGHLEKTLGAVKQ